LQKYNNELHANSIIKRDLQEEKQKNAELLALIQQAKERKEQEQAAQIKKQAQQKEQEQNQVIACKENAKLILKALNPAKFEELLEQLEDNPDFELLEGPGQVRLIKYYANKILKV
jgi:cell pole-organizing protein PopZ